jgi:hypothetical protein
MFEQFRALQKQQPWTDIWTGDFKNDPRSYSRFQHCMINVAAHLGKILQRVERADHYGEDYPQALNADDIAESLAVIVMSAMKAANVYPEGPLDIARYIESDLRRRSDG